LTFYAFELHPKPKFMFSMQLPHSHNLVTLIYTIFIIAILHANVILAHPTNLSYALDSTIEYTSTNLSYALDSTI